MEITSFFRGYRRRYHIVVIIVRLMRTRMELTVRDAKSEIGER